MKKPALTGMQLTVNGEPCRLAAPPTLAALLKQRQVPTRRVAVLVNDNVVPSNRWSKLRLCEGDRIEIVSFAGGG